MTSAISIGIKQMKPIDRNSSPIHLFAIVLITGNIDWLQTENTGVDYREKPPNRTCRIAFRCQDGDSVD